MTEREEALALAASYVTGQRDAQYGSPSDNFRNIANLWSILFDRTFTKEDVAVAMIAVKLARLSSNSGFQGDTWIDIAGYAACGYEVGKSSSAERSHT